MLPLNGLSHVRDGPVEPPVTTHPSWGRVLVTGAAGRRIVQRLTGRHTKSFRPAPNSSSDGAGPCRPRIGTALQGMAARGHPPHARE